MELFSSRIPLSNLCATPSLKTLGPKYMLQENIPWREFAEISGAVPLWVTEGNLFWNKSENLTLIHSVYCEPKMNQILF